MWWEGLFVTGSAGARSSNERGASWGSHWSVDGHGIVFVDIEHR